MPPHTMTPQVRVLIVEGPLLMHRGVGRSLAVVLHLHGYSARAVYSCRDASTELKKFKPHVVIIELLLDEMVGPGLAKRLRDAAPDVGIVLYGGNPAAISDYNREEKLGGVFMILQKPIRPKTLLAEIDRVARRRTEVYRA